MDPITQQTVLAAAGAAGGDPVYVDDVFSTFLYEGTGSAQTITNGIDISGEGGLVWLKSRSLAEANVLGDTETGITKRLYSNSSTGQAVSNMLTSANSNGFTLGTSNITNTNNSTNVSWTFRKQKGFFDVVTFSASSNQIPHSLGSTPGMIIVKRTDAASDWFVYHRSFSNPNANYMKLNDSTSVYSGINGNWEATDTYFKFQIFGIGTWVAYIFAHDDAQFGTDRDESIIKCGQFEANPGTAVNLGFEPQWVLVKRIDGSREWFVIDNMRGMSGSADQNSQYLSPNTTNTESDNRNIFITSTGFTVATSSAFHTDTHIYMAIRRPHKPPEVATEVFAIDSRNSTSPVAAPSWKAPFPVDFAMHKWAGPGNGVEWGIGSRLQGRRVLVSNSNAAESSASIFSWDWQNGFYTQTGVYSDEVGWMFKRAPGFMDVVTYNGSTNYAVQNIPHSLKVVPEMYWVKGRNFGDNWMVYHKATGNAKMPMLNSDWPAYNNTNLWNSTSPTSSVFTVGNDAAVNRNGTCVAYLFATLPGISKVDSYSGTGNAINVDCGFTNGARFIMIKRTDSTGGWYVWDSLRGIVSGNDPYVLLNSSNGGVSNTDYVDPLSTGFTVTASAPAALNASGGTYLFLAIA